MRRFGCLFLALALGCSNGPPPKAEVKAPPAPATAPALITEVSLTKVKWTELEKAIAAHKGKVIIVDVWANYCIPCKEKFPHMLELQKKYADKGLVLIAVNLDDDDDAAKALAFLKKVDAKIENYRLDEKADVVEDKLGGTALPIVNVFGRDGKRAKAYTEHPIEIEDVEKLAVSLLS